MRTVAVKIYDANTGELLRETTVDDPDDAFEVAGLVVEAMVK